MSLIEREKDWGENLGELKADSEKKAASARWQAKLAMVAVEFILLFAFWVLISGHYQLKYLIIGLVASALVTFLTKDLIYNPGNTRARPLKAGYIGSCIGRLIAYVPWLIWAILKANIQVAIIILQPRMPIDPGFLQFKTQLSRKVSLVTLANSITLTPGTITVDLTRNTFLVHALSRAAASDIESGLMQNKAGAIFCEERETAPICSWRSSVEELEK